MLKEKLTALFRDAFGREPEFMSRAPGRIEFIGNHTDYNGGTVLGAAIDRGIWVAVAKRDDGRRRFRSDFAEGVVELTGEVVPQEGDTSWTNYPMGMVAGAAEFGVTDPGGFDFAVLSDLPPGAGLSSSAALELASGLAILQLTGQSLDRETLVKWGRHAENNFVGVPCGILDQGVSGFGRRDHLVYIDCSGPAFGVVPMPADSHFWVFNTHTKHALVDGLYSARHRECMEAAQAIGVNLLAETDEAALVEKAADMSETAAKRARHVLTEITRVEQTIGALRAGELAKVGAALTASHRSSQHDFENSTKELDVLVDVLVATPGVFGARLSGGGFGGAVMALTDGSFGEASAAQVVAAYREKFGADPQVLHLRAGEGAETIAI